MDDDDFQVQPHEDENNLEVSFCVFIHFKKILKSSWQIE